MIYALLLAAGIVLLVKSADWLVDGASALAKRLNITNIVIGLTVVAFGTSAPEFVVSALAAAQGNGELSLANIVGSVTTNILLGIGVAAIIIPLSVKRGTVWREIPFSLMAIVVVWLLANDQLVQGGGITQISWVDGVVLLSFFVIFMAYIFGISSVQPDDTIQEHVKEMPIARASLMVLVGIIGLSIGGNVIVSNAIELAATLQISEKLVALLLIGPGTSLPELAATVSAARKRNVDMAIGGIVGSNIFNILLIIGTSAVINNLQYDPVMNVDLALIGMASLLLFFSLFTGKKHHVDRWQGVTFVLVYGCYIVYLLYRG